jgi:hypothetical protein
MDIKIMIDRWMDRWMDVKIMDRWMDDGKMMDGWRKGGRDEGKFGYKLSPIIFHLLSLQGHPSFYSTNIYLVQI